MFKKILFFLLLAFLWWPNLGSAQSQKVDLYFFWANGCPHCEKENIFLDKLENKYVNFLTVKRFEVSTNQTNAKLLREFGDKLQADISGVPFTVIGEQYFIGFYNEATTGAQIENKIIESIRPLDFSETILTPPLIERPVDRQPTDQEVVDQPKIEAEATKNWPVVGNVDLKNLSLPAITVVLGFLDGFNPCAMWVLIFLISLLLGLNDRKKMWILGTVFIVTSALIYFIFMVAWLNLILFLGFIIWLRLAIAAIALLGGGYNLRAFFMNKDGGCPVTGGENRQKVFTKLKNIINEKNLWLALAGIILLAAIVNLVELFCSAGLPVVYTQILTLNNLPVWQYYFYLVFYIFIFMLDDLLVFFLAMVTLRLTGVTTKYSRYSKLISGIIMLIIGILLITKPEWLMFN